MNKTSTIKYHAFKDDAPLKDAFKVVEIGAYQKFHKEEVIHRHSFFELQFVWEGHGEQDIDFKKYTIVNNHLFFIQPNQVHKANKAVLKNADIIIFKQEYLGFLANIDILEPSYRVSSHCFRLSAQHVSLLKKYLYLLKKEYQTDMEQITMQGLMLSLIGRIGNILNQSSEYPTSLDPRTDQFLKLIEEDYKHYHTANYYADKLNLSVKHLNNIISKEMGKTASALIRDRITLEIKRLLSYTSKNHKEIAYELGFKDPYYMSHFFKNQTGVRPSAFKG